MVQIQVGQGQGITQAIKAKALADGINISNNVNASIWGQVMNEVKSANSAQSEEQKFYTGGEDTEKLDNRANWKTDFQVAKDQVITLAQDVWNKIVALLTGESSAPKTQQDVSAAKPNPSQKPEAPKSSVTNDETTATPSASLPTTKSEGTLTAAQPAQTATVTDHPPVYYEAGNVPLENAKIPVVTDPKEGENPEYDAAVNLKTADVVQGPLTPQQLEEFLANDTTYQGYDAQLTRMDNRMSEIEAKYDMPRIRDIFHDELKFGSEEWSAQFNIVDKPENREYTSLGVNYTSLHHDLNNYKKVMQNWVDGPCGEKSYFQRNNTRYTNLERITLNDGRRAWKTDQGTFLPASDGMPGGAKIE